MSNNKDQIKFIGLQFIVFIFSLALTIWAPPVAFLLSFWFTIFVLYKIATMANPIKFLPYALACCVSIFGVIIGAFYRLLGTI